VRKSRYSDEQIAAALRQAEAGTPIADITTNSGISEATFYASRKHFGSWERRKSAGYGNCVKKTRGSSGSLRI
jgi:hypothetical protein